LENPAVTGKIPLARRIHLVPGNLPGAAVTEDGMQALALVDAPDHVCCRYRIRAFEPALGRAGWSLDVLGLAQGPLSRLRQLSGLPRYETIVLQRKLLPDWQLRAIRRKARQLVFDFDDAVLFRDSYDPRGPESARRARRFAATVRAADAIIAGNDFLADCALRAGARPDSVRVIPTCVATEKYEPSDGRDGIGALELVWVGSSSTLQGLERQRETWHHLARDVPGVRLRVICDRFPELGAMPVVPVTWSEATEAAELAASDAGVSWVPDDLWSRGKCGLKVLQYQAAGLPVLANPVGVHVEMVKPGINGWLPTTREEWADAARTLAGDPALRRRMARAARASVEAGYSVKAWEATFVATVRGASAVPSPNLRLTGPARSRQLARTGQDRGHGHGPIGANG
jgi:glycosyltransferase involved in cell wall biosynthesis